MNTNADAKRTESGQGMIEFALALTVFILIFLVIFDLARAVYTNNILSSMVREGARYAILDPTNNTEIIKAAKAVAFGVNSADITVTPSCSPDCAPGNDVRVQATYTFRPITPFLPTLNQKSVSTMTIE